MLAASDKIGMEGMGGRMRARARELGWSDAEVARRLGLAQTRYANYVTDRHEPDLATLVRICGVLGLSADGLLGIGHPSGEASAGLDARISAAFRMLDLQSAEVALIVVDALATRSRSLQAIQPKERGKPKRAS